MKNLPWDKLSPNDFEEFAQKLIEKMGFLGVTQYSGSSDGGVDITGTRMSEIGGILCDEQKWVFQCKRRKKISHTEILEDLNKLKSTKIYAWALVTTIKPSSQFKQWFNQINAENKFPFKITAFWKEHLDHLALDHKDYLINFFPDFYPPNNIGTKNNLYSISIEEINAKFRDINNRRIERFAKGKYIKNLYVNRELQGTLENFHSTEPKIAKEFKVLTKNLLIKEIDSLRDYVQKYSLIPKKYSKRVQLQKGIGEFLLSPEGLVVIRKTSNDAKPLISQFDEHLQDALKLVSGLSDSQFIKSIHERRRVSKIIHSSIAIVRKFPSFVFSENHIFLKLPKSKTKKTSQEKGIRKSANKTNNLTSLTSLIQNQYEKFRKQIFTYLINEFDDDGWQFDLGHKRIEFNLEQQIAVTTQRLEIILTEIESLNKNSLLILDRAGSGKTNLLCHMSDKLAQTQPTLLLFGKENFSGPEGIIKSVNGIISKVCEGGGDDLLNAFNAILEKEGKFLNVFIDGINENRNIPNLDSAISEFLGWAKKYRIRITATCRDIYWTFFNYDQWKDNARSPYKGELNEFSTAEYKSALPLYLSHYNIKCELMDDAMQACHHPLLLRFFCEAYGSIDGPSVVLGKIRDIRLKELFDKYIDLKAEQIKRFLNHGNTDAVISYLLNVVEYIFLRNSNSILSSDLSEATLDDDLSTKDSLYLRLLDEDIIFEEDPTDDHTVRVVSFVYEEFMEYLVAKAILTNPKRFGVETSSEIFSLLSNKLSEWINARGVGEYIAISLLTKDFDRPWAETIEFMECMSKKSHQWEKAYWSVVGKCSMNNLRPEVFDIFHSALHEQPNYGLLKSAITSVVKYNENAGETLAEILIWSIALPNIFNWQNFFDLSELNSGQAEKLGLELKRKISNGTRYDPPQDFRYGRFIKGVISIFDLSEQTKIIEGIQHFGEPRGAYSYLRVITKSFSSYYPYLINGLFSSDAKVRDLCADRLRFCRDNHSTVKIILGKILEGEMEASTRNILSRSVELI